MQCFLNWTGFFKKTKASIRQGKIPLVFFYCFKHFTFTKILLETINGVTASLMKISRPPCSKVDHQNVQTKFTKCWYLKWQISHQTFFGYVSSSEAYRCKKDMVH